MARSLAEARKLVTQLFDIEVPAQPPAGEPYNIARAKESMDYALECMKSALALAQLGDVREAARTLQVATAWLRFAEKYLEYQIKEILRLAGEGA